MNKPRSGAEWVGGIVALPQYVTGEGEPYRPEALFWTDATGLVLGQLVGPPGRLLDVAAECLRRTIAQPLIGAPHAPARVRVATAELAVALRGAHPGVEIVVAPTPEVDALLEALRAHMASADADADASYLSPEVEADAIAALFRAGAALFRAKPWAHVPSDQCVIAVTIERLDVRDAVVSIIGQLGQSFGFLVFERLDGYEAFVEASEAIERGEPPRIPPHLALNFERGADVSPVLRKEISRHRWEVAGVAAYPMLIAIDEDLVARPPTADEVTLAEAIARALPVLLGEQRALRAAWEGEAAVERTLAVTTHAGELEVILRAPAEAAGATWHGRPDDELAALHALERRGDVLDDPARGDLEEALVDAFVRAPEAAGLPAAAACRLIMDYAAACYGVTIATLRPPQLREIVFEVIPGQVSFAEPAADVAAAIVAESRAFYAYLQRAHGLIQAEACLRVLGGDAVARLEAALADTGSFGLAKSLVAAGRAAGFDMDSEAGLQAWARAVSSPPPAPPRSPVRKRATPSPPPSRRASSSARPRASARGTAAATRTPGHGARKPRSKK